jgi:putative heme-binding domain-containing protein
MALRNQLSAPGIAEKIPPAGASEADLRNLTDVAVGSTSPAAVSLLVRRISGRTDEATATERFVRFITRNGNDAQADETAKIIADRFANDDGLQLTLFKAMQEGLAQRNARLGAAAQKLAHELAGRLLDRPEEDFGGWVNSPAPEFPNAKNPWSVQMRNSIDGVVSAPFISSLPLGEPGTGVLRSKTFTIPDHFSFFFAGHSGSPGRPNTMKNVLRLRAADTNEILAEAPSVRNDLARKVELNVAKFAGRAGYIEAVDSDNGTAYAWIAFGRFDPPVVSIPNTEYRPLRTAIEIAGDLNLADLAAKIAAVLSNPKAEADNRIAAAKALAAINPTDHTAALVSALSDVSAPIALRDAAGAALAQVNALTVQTAMVEAIHTAPQKLQLSLAKSLAATSHGADSLLSAIGEGKASPRLLLDNTLRERLKVSNPPDLDQRITKLTANLPAADQVIQKLIDQRAAHFDRAKASAERGAKVFATNCQVCHRINNQGNQIGPQLDGIGVRGVPRVAEDILDPSRNVDAAFRYSTFVLEGGDVIAGIPRREEGQTLIIADSTGKEVPIQKSKITRRVESNLSLMPSNFGEILKEEDFDDLMSFLLSK